MSESEGLSQEALIALERLQAYRIADKRFVVYKGAAIDRVVGPGGGIGAEPEGD